jgi:hypothetical protein
MPLMPCSGTLGNPHPYTPFGVFAGLPFWGGGATVLAVAPGIGKTSWLPRMIFESVCLRSTSYTARNLFRLVDYFVLRLFIRTGALEPRVINVPLSITVLKERPGSSMR